MLHLRQRAVILQPAGEEAPGCTGGAFHPGQAGIHVQRVRLRSLPGEVGAKLYGCRQLRGLLLQHGLLGLQRLLQGLFQRSTALMVGSGTSSIRSIRISLSVRTSPAV